MVNVFISYSHESEAHSRRVLELSNRLVEDGIDCILDQYVNSPPEGWPGWIETQLAKSKWVLVICTETYFKRVNGESKGVKWESTIPYQYLYDSDSKNQKFIPVVFTPEHARYIPTPLKGVTFYSLESEDGYLQLYRFLTGQPKVRKPELGKIKNLSSFTKISLHKLPVTEANLFGRERELALLDEAWQDAHTHVMILLAWGGVGKTSLVNHWLALMEKNNFQGAELVYGWSFYSQGTGEGRQASADEFMHETLRWFGDTNPSQGSNTEKGRRLASLIGEKKTLLILDGLEPLQYPPNEGHGLDGQLKDHGLKALLKDLALSCAGLCIITTREPVTDLQNRIGNTVKEINLGDLSDKAGIELLKSMGIKGLKQELLEAVGEYKGHALALTLLGNYLSAVHNSDIRKRDRIPALMGEQKQGQHVIRVMKAYEAWLGNKGKPELDILYIMGLFDGPAPGGAVDILKEEPPIPGVTDSLPGLKKADWFYALRNLRKLSLLAPENPVNPGSLDCSPLVREYFAGRLEQRNPVGLQAAHQRLYEYYKSLPDKEFPDTLEELAPLFSAAAHGCRAGLHQEAFEEVFWTRVRRKSASYTLKKLGAFSADLTALSHFFDLPWSKPAEELTRPAQAVVLNWAAFSLRAMGRLHEAIQPMQTGMDMHIEQEDRQNAAKSADNLSELMLTLGKINESVDFGAQAVYHADKSGDGFLKELSRTVYADALHQAGQWQKALALFQEAEAMQKERQPEFYYLYSLQGYLFCDLLLERGQYREVLERAAAAREWTKQYGGLLSIALAHLSLGRAWMMKVQEQDSKDWTNTAQFLDQAVAGLRKYGSQQHLPRGLLARAQYHRLRQDYDAAWTDLHEALEIAELGSMNLHLCDYHLEAARLCTAQARDKEAKNHRRSAKKMIHSMGYLRRLKELP